MTVQQRAMVTVPHISFLSATTRSVTAKQSMIYLTAGVLLQVYQCLFSSQMHCFALKFQFNQIDLYEESDTNSCCGENQDNEGILFVIVPSIMFGSKIHH